MCNKTTKSNSYDRIDFNTLVRFIVVPPGTDGLTTTKRRSRAVVVSLEVPGGTTMNRTRVLKSILS